MKKSGLIIIGVLVVILAALQVIVCIGKSPATVSDSNVTLVTAPAQEEAMENDQFKIEEYVSPEIEGTNVALGATAIDNGYTDIYMGSQAVDGRRESTSYWEGPADGDGILTVNFDKVYSIHSIRLALNPDPIWGPRTQTLFIETSEDGKNFKELVGSNAYDFDPKTGNEIIIDNFNETKAKSVRVTITDNTGAGGGQIAELEVYSKDK